MNCSMFYLGVARLYSVLPPCSQHGQHASLLRMRCATAVLEILPDSSRLVTSSRLLISSDARVFDLDLGSPR